MKTQHIFLSVLFTLISLIKVTAGTEAPSPDFLKPKVIIRLTLGAPPPSCTRFGICQLEVMPGWMRTEPGYAIAECQADDTGSRITFSIDTRTGIDPITLERFFGSGVFTMESDVWLDQTVAGALMVRSGSRIPAGKWSVTTVQGIMRFTVELR